MAKEVEQLDRATPGALGVYVKRLENGEAFAYQAERGWYLASATKLPIAIAVLQEAEAGKLRLQDTLALREDDKIDGAGDVVWKADGTQFSVETLLSRMLDGSDNTAANMLVRAMGTEVLNQRAQGFLGRDFGELTTFTQVRRDVYGEVHPNAAKLTSIQLVQVAGAPMGTRRFEALRRAMGAKRAELKVASLDEAYARYYARQRNTVSLQDYADMLEQLVRGKLLPAPAMQSLYTDLKFDTYDAYRLEAGLPRTVRFIHKTGTQFQRACHMGVVNPQDGGGAAIVIAACAEGLDEGKQAGPMFERLGRAITRTALAAQDASGGDKPAR